MIKIISSGRAEETIQECVNKCGSCEKAIRKMCQGNNNGLSNLSTESRQISSRKK